jgi:hypothetical protein
MKFKLIIILRDGFVIDNNILFCGADMDINGANFRVNANARGNLNFNPADIDRIVIQPRNHGEEFSI